MLNFVLELAGQTLRHPRRAADTVLGFEIERGTLWLILALVSVVSVLFTEFTMLFVPAEMVAANSTFPDSLYLLTFVIWGVLAMSVFMTHYVGQAFGGQGEFDGSLKAVIWMQIVLLVLQIVQIALFLISPVVAIFFGWIGALYVFYIFLEFVKTLHVFQSLGLVFAGAMVSVIGLVFCLALVIGLIAGMLGLEVGANV